MQCKWAPGSVRREVSSIVSDFKSAAHLDQECFEMKSINFCKKSLHAPIHKRTFTKTDVKMLSKSLDQVGKKLNLNCNKFNIFFVKAFVVAVGFAF